MRTIFKTIIGSLRRIVREMFYLGWTLAGTGLVLITLSSTTLKQGIYISVAGLALHLVGTVLDYVDDERSDDSDK
jgi:hypothetical protein